MHQELSHSCPNCEYEHGNCGKPVLKGNLIECRICGTSWKEFSGTSLVTDPGRKHLEILQMLSKMARNEDNPRPVETLPETPGPTPGAKGFVGTLVFVALMMGGTLSTVWISGHVPDRSANSGEPVSISGVKHREQIGRHGRKIITVRGNINNRTHQDLLVPRLTIILRRKNGGEIVRWQYNPPARLIVAGGKTRFASSIQYDTPVIAYAEAVIK